ncbi:cadherin repeat domain-containing protein, partial [Anabaena sp. FACHB-1391]|uniref:cadherin repeat domain-containing protein n=1 Tax=Anabaena sp. FACHB-1391 TaxID=2692771 RepID=UPI0016808CFA
MPNQAPTNLTLNNSAFTLTINEGETTVSDFISTDPDTGKTFTYSLIAGVGDIDNSSFDFVGNQLRTRTLLDFETKNSYSIRVKQIDQDESTLVERKYNINVNDINEAPTDLSYDNNTDTTTIDEGKPIGTVVGNLSSTDQDTGNTFTYSLVTGDGATDNSLFNITGNQLKTNAVFDFETKNSYSIRVQTTDQGRLSFEKQLNITVTNVNDINEAPTDLLLDNTAIDEGQTDTVIGNLISIDPDTRNTFTYSLVTGTGATDNSLFTITNN